MRSVLSTVENHKCISTGIVHCFQCALIGQSKFKNVKQAQFLPYIKFVISVSTKTLDFYSNDGKILPILVIPNKKSRSDAYKKGLIV